MAHSTTYRSTYPRPDDLPLTPTLTLTLTQEANSPQRDADFLNASYDFYQRMVADTGARCYALLPP